MTGPDDDLRVTPRVPPALAFVLRLLLVLAVVTTAGVALYAAVLADRASVRWRAGR